MNAFLQQTIRRKRKVQIPAARAGDRETMSEPPESEEDTEDEELARPGAGASAGTSRRNDRSASLGGREQSTSPRSDRRSVTSAGPLRPSKVTLVKSRKSEGESGGLLEQLSFILRLSRFVKRNKPTNNYMHYTDKKYWDV